MEKVAKEIRRNFPFSSEKKNPSNEISICNNHKEFVSREGEEKEKNTFPSKSWSIYQKQLKGGKKRQNRWGKKEEEEEKSF